ncbi:MAG: helicase HerA domain-containing protein [Candidatus Woesearchaeota archaeon]
MEKKKFNLILFVSILLAVGLLIFLNELTGFLVLDGEAGYIHEVNIQGRIRTGTWFGMYGVITMDGNFTEDNSVMAAPGEILYKDTMLKCFDVEGIELYLSTHMKGDINHSYLRGATYDEIDDFIGYTGMLGEIRDGARQTFKENFTIDIGGRDIDVIGAYLNSGGDEFNGQDPEAFKTFALVDDSSGAFLFGTQLVSPRQSFDNRFVNYQIMVPVPLNLSMKEYFIFGDPSDFCVNQEGMGTFFKGYIRGYVTDGRNGDPLEGVEIVLGGNTTYTDADGFYSMVLPQGGHVIGAFLSPFEDYFDIVTIPPLQTLVYDFQMFPPTDFVPPEPRPDEDEPEPPRVELPQEIYRDGIWIAPRVIERFISEGSFAIEEIGVFNAGDRTVNLFFEVTGNVSQITKMRNGSITLEPRESAFNELTFFGYEKGVFTGELVVSGDMSASIPIKITVTDEELGIRGIFISLDMLTPAYIGQSARFKTTVTNLLVDQEFPVFINYVLRSEDNPDLVIDIGSEEIYLRDTHSSVNTFTIPKNFTEGYYTLEAYASYLDTSTRARTLVPVTYPPHRLLTAKVFGNMPLYLFLIILAIILAILNYFYQKVKKNIKSKKRFDAKVHYKMLPQRDEPSSIFIGKIAETNTDAFFDMNKLTVHSIIAGSTGGGKSISAQVIVEECLKKNVAVIVFDPTAQWSSMIRKCADPHFLSLYEQFGMDPEKDARAFPGNVRAVKNSKEVLNVMEYVKPGEIQVFTATTLDPEDYDVFVANTVREVFHANMQEHPDLRILFVYDEIHRILPKFGGAGNGYIQIERACREFRKWGIGIILISQVLADFVGDIKANINTEIQMKTRDEGDLERIKMKYGEEFVRGLVKAPVGSGMLQNSAFNRGKPYYITFRPIQHSVSRLSDEELEQYNDANDRIDQINYELSQLRENDKDTFDLELEVKLALDKVKVGNFNMVNIYLESLEPRIAKIWNELGKKPKKLKREMIDEDEFMDVIEQAKKARESFMSGGSGSSGGSDESASPLTSSSTASTSENGASSKLGENSASNETNLSGENNVLEDSVSSGNSNQEGESHVVTQESSDSFDEVDVNSKIEKINELKEKYDALDNKGTSDAIDLLGDIGKQTKTLPSAVISDNKEFFDELDDLKNKLSEDELNGIIERINEIKEKYDAEIDPESESAKLLASDLKKKSNALPDNVKAENKEFFDELEGLVE